MKISFRDIWPSAHSIFRSYVVCAVLLGSVAALLEKKGVDARLILGCMVALVLPIHLGIYAITRRVASPRRSKPNREEGPRSKAAAAGSGGL